MGHMPKVHISFHFISKRYYKEMIPSEAGGLRTGSAPDLGPLLKEGLWEFLLKRGRVYSSCKEKVGISAGKTGLDLLCPQKCRLASGRPWFPLRETLLRKPCPEHKAGRLTMRMSNPSCLRAGDARLSFLCDLE